MKQMMYNTRKTNEIQIQRVIDIQIICLYNRHNVLTKVFSENEEKM